MFYVPLNCSFKTLNFWHVNLRSTIVVETTIFHGNTQGIILPMFIFRLNMKKRSFSFFWFAGPINLCFYINANFTAKTLREGCLSCGPTFFLAEVFVIRFINFFFAHMFIRESHVLLKPLHMKTPVNSLTFVSTNGTTNHFLKCKTHGPILIVKNCENI